MPTQKTLKERIEKILAQVLMKHHDDISKQDDDAVGEAADQILQVTNKGRLPCEHLTFKTENSKIVELFINGEEWKPASPRYEKL